MKKVFFFGIFLILSQALTACSTKNDPASKLAKKVAVASAKKQAKNAVKEGAAPVIEAAKYMTELENELSKALSGTGLKMVRQKNDLILTLDGTSAFNATAYNLKPSAVEHLKKIAPVLRRYDKTRITILGHTDKSGKPATNQLLSEKRAESVAGTLEKEGVADTRFFIEGKGSTAPVTQKETEAHKNNRIEIKLQLQAGQ